MKVLLVTETLNDGGAELFVLRLAKALLAKGEQVQVLSLNKEYENVIMTKKFADLPIQRLSLPFLSLIEKADKVLCRTGIDFSIKYYLQARKLKRIVKNFDIVHSHYIQADYLIATIKKDAFFKHVVTVHGDYSAQYDKFKKGQLRFWLQLDRKLEFLSTSVDKWVILSEEQRGFFNKIMNVLPERITKIYNGYPNVTSTDSVQMEPEVFTIGMVARGTKEKGWELLIEAFLKMPDNTKLLLVGGGKYMDELKATYSENSRIIFAGFQPDPMRWMQQMDVFVLPTIYPYESLPTVIMEALHCGLPVIATNVGEIENMITDDKTGQKAGFVIDFDGIGVNKQELLSRLMHLYQNPLEAEEMSKIAKGTAIKFSMEKCVGAYQRIYTTVLKLL